MDIQAWVAIDKTFKITQSPILDPDLKFLGDLNTPDIEGFFYVNKLGNKLFGIDVKNRIFIINGMLVDLQLPESAYELIAFRRVSIHTDKPREYGFAFGLKTTIDNQSKKWVFILQPDNTILFEQ